MSCKKELTLIREFIRETLSESLESKFGADLSDAQYDTAFGPEPPTYFQSRGHHKVSYDGTPMSAILSILGAPASSYDLYKNFFGPSGFFNFSGIFGDRASPFGRDVNRVGAGLLSPISRILGPRDAGSVGQGYWQNLRSAFSGNLALRRESANLSPSQEDSEIDVISEPFEILEPEPEIVQQIVPDQFQQEPVGASFNESDIIRSLSSDIQKIVSDFSQIKSSNTWIESVQNWQRATGFGETPIEVFEEIGAMVGTQEGDFLSNSIKSFIENQMAPVYYSDIITPVLDGFLSPDNSISAQTRGTAVSMLEDALSIIN